MKKIIAAALAFSVAFAVKAQEIPDRKHEGYKPHVGPGKMHHRRPGGMVFKELNLTEAQKEQMKTQREAFRKQLEELKKNDNITVKEWRSRMENLRIEQKSKMENILTSEQKAKFEKMKADRKAIHDVEAKSRLEKMKIRLGLSDDQVSKMEKNRKELAEKIRSIRENKSLSHEKKREEMKELMKKQKENMKSILTEEQFKKMKESKHRHPHSDGKKPVTKMEVI